MRLGKLGALKLARCIRYEESYHSSVLSNRQVSSSIELRLSSDVRVELLPQNADLLRLRMPLLAQLLRLGMVA